MSLDNIQTPSFISEFVSRNEGIITPYEQDVLQATRVLVAGCGSVGGSIVEPLVRLGVGTLVLADPDEFETSNLNRQACSLGDVGRPKPDVLAERARAINPFVHTQAICEGLTTDNIEPALRNVRVVFDGVDSAPPSLWIKYLLHKCAAENRIPVVLGVDFGGKPTLYIWDYRQDPTPFYGKSRAEDFREGREVAALRPWMGVTAVPTEFLPVIRERMMTDKPWPQVSYCATGLGALGSRAILDVVMGRDVNHIITADVHMLLKPRRKRIVDRMQWPGETVRTLLSLKRSTQSAFQVKAEPSESTAIPKSLLPVAQAVQRAPSGHNAQPWKLHIDSESSFRLGWDRSRSLDVVDPEGRYICYSLGCALEAANTVAQISFDPSTGTDVLAPDWHAGNVRVEGLRDDTFFNSSGLLGLRGTDRGPFLTDAIPGRLIEEFSSLAAGFGVNFWVAQDRRSIVSVAELTARAAAINLASEEFLDELMYWIRPSRKARRWDEDGFTAETLKLDPATKRLMSLLKRSSRIRRTAQKLGLPKAMAAHSGDVVRQSGAIFLLTNSDSSPQGRIVSGRAMMAIWLAATEATLAIHPMNFSLDVTSVRPEVMGLFGVAPSDDAVALLRIGRARATPPPSSRLPLDQICEIDYGHSPKRRAFSGTFND